MRSAPLARLAALLAVVVAGPALADLFSPGDLSKPHEELEGLSNCTKCHPAGDKLSQQKCLSPCHEELPPGIKAGRGLHGRLPREQRACESCHHEHQGREAKLVDWGTGGKNGFDHRRSGWALKGAHQEAECKACHEKRLITWPVAVKLLEKRATLLGLEQGCESCHYDEHRGQVKEDCDYCHNEVKWKPAPGFDHDATDYALKGKHLKVKCDKCHPAERDEENHGFPAPKSETFLKLVDLKHAACTDCHKDPHDNRFGQRCTSCHVVDGWSILRNTSKEREFHQKARFPLKGAHEDVSCPACHGPWPGQRAKFKGLKFNLCADCHGDAHHGQLEGTPRPPDCGACHTVDGFQPATYGLPEHARASYPLEGAHRAVPCDECHEPAPGLAGKVPRAVLVELKRLKRKELFSPARFDFAKAPDSCESCHTDVHGKQFQDRARGCAGCHQVQGFRQLTFDHQTDSKYPLTGRHQKVDCDQCHFVPQGASVVRYRPLEQKCSACHEDPHAAQFSSGNEPAACERCHVTDDWAQLSFVHQPPFTTFLLEGQHARAKCEACHARVALGPKLEVVRYKPLPTTCEGCHVDFHQGAFQGFEP